MEPALQYVSDVGGAWAEEAYQYLGAILHVSLHARICFALCV